MGAGHCKWGGFTERTVCKAIATIFFVSPHSELRKPSQSEGKKKDNEKNTVWHIRYGQQILCSRQANRACIFLFLSNFWLSFHKQTP